MDIQRIKWRVLLYAAAGTLVMWTAIIALKLNGQLVASQSWPVLIACPPLLNGVFPALFFWHGRRKTR